MYICYVYYGFMYTLTLTLIEKRMNKSEKETITLCNCDVFVMDMIIIGNNPPQINPTSHKITYFTLT